MKFTDTSWWVAWSLPDDRHHDDALSLLGRLGPAEQVLTTNLVIGETWTYLRRRDGHRSAVAFLDRIETLVAQGRLVVHRVSAEAEARAWVWLRRHDERPFSFVDATSFQTMSERRLREAFAFDQDFSAAGFTELRP